MSEQENNWPACVPEDYRNTMQRKDTGEWWGPDKWALICLAAQADGWRWEQRDKWAHSWSAPMMWSFDGEPADYRIAHGPVPAGCEVRIGDGVWIVPEGSKAWTPCHRSPKDSQWFSIDPREAGDTSLPCGPVGCHSKISVYYALPVAKEAAPDTMSEEMSAAAPEATVIPKTTPDPGQPAPEYDEARDAMYDEMLRDLRELLDNKVDPIAVIRRLKVYESLVRRPAPAPEVVYNSKRDKRGWRLELDKYVTGPDGQMDTLALEQDGYTVTITKEGK